MTATHDMPLAARMRPRTLDEVAGQRHLIGPGKLLRRMIEADRIAMRWQRLARDHDDEQRKDETRSCTKEAWHGASPWPKPRVAITRPTARRAGSMSGGLKLPNDRDGRTIRPGDPMLAGFNLYDRILSLGLREDGWRMHTGTSLGPDDDVWIPSHIEVI